jgi:hypothetical protein
MRAWAEQGSFDSAETSLREVPASLKTTARTFYSAGNIEVLLRSENRELGTGDWELGIGHWPLAPENLL